MPTARQGKKPNEWRNSPNAKMRVMMMIGCIADLMCGAVRSRPGGPVEKVVAAGGSKGSGPLSTVEIYDVESNMWKKVKSSKTISQDLNNCMCSNSTPHMYLSQRILGHV